MHLSGSVYGIKTERNVTEDLDLEPISTYNKVKNGYREDYFVLQK